MPIELEGALLNITTSSVSIGTWNGTAFSVGGTTPNAVKVVIGRTNAGGNPIYLYFASIFGVRTLDVTGMAIAIFSQSIASPFITAHANPWLAGAANGTQASVPDPAYAKNSATHQWKYDYAGTYNTINNSKDAFGDVRGEPYATPALIGITVQPGSTIQITSVSGTTQHEIGGSNFTADGFSGGSMSIYNDAAAVNEAENGIADTSAPLDSMLGLFLNNSSPTSTAAPATTDFTSQAARDYSSISPQLKQVFFIGNGVTSTGIQQTILVPAGATRFYMAMMDGWEWSNNGNGYNATVTQTRYSIVQ